MTSKTLRIQRVANGWMVTDDALDPTGPTVPLSDIRVAMTLADLTDIIKGWALAQTVEPSEDVKPLKQELGGSY